MAAARAEFQIDAGTEGEAPLPAGRDAAVGDRGIPPAPPDVEPSAGAIPAKRDRDRVGELCAESHDGFALGSGPWPDAYTCSLRATSAASSERFRTPSFS